MDGHARREFAASPQRRPWLADANSQNQPAPSLPRLAALLQEQQPHRPRLTEHDHRPVDSHTHDQQVGQAASSSSSDRSSTASSSNGSERAPARMQTNYKPRVNGSDTSRPVRTSRYLREEDRRDILSRIEDGEKQADLAKEFQVSRAAISNIKQRRIRKDLQHLRQYGLGASEHDGDAGNQGDEAAMSDSSESARVHCKLETAELQQPSQFSHRVRAVAADRSAGFGFKHEPTGPSEPRAHQRSSNRYELYDSYASSDLQRDSKASYHWSPVSQSPSPSIDDVMEPQQQLERVTELNSSSTELLFTRLIDQQMDARAFQVAASRLARLLLEYALSIFPTRVVRIPVPEMARAPTATRFFMGLEATRKTCAVTVPEDGGGEVCASVLLKAFQAIEPSSGFGFVAPRPAGDGYDVQVPRNIHDRNVVLLVELLDSQSSRHAVTVVQAILECGAELEAVVLVALCCERKALTRVLQAYPEMRVVASKIFFQASESTSDELCKVLRSRLSYKMQKLM